MNLSFARITAAVLLATVATAEDSVAVNSRTGLNDQVIATEIAGVWDLDPASNSSVQLVGGYRRLEESGSSADEYTVGAGVRLDIDRDTVFAFGLGLRLRDGSDVVDTEQDVTTTSTTTSTETTTITTPGRVHTPHGRGHHYGWAHQGPHTTTVTNEVTTTTTTIDHVYGTANEQLDDSPLVYASLLHSIDLSKYCGLELAANGVLLLDGFEANIGAMLTHNNIGLGCVDQVREYYSGAGELLSRVESEDRGLAIVGRIALDGGMTIGADYLIDQETVMAVVGLKF
jgi:hypothetical protein